MLFNKLRTYTCLWQYTTYKIKYVETVRIDFLISALNNLKILAGDLQNAYLYGFTKEKLYFKVDDEWKSSALVWRNYLADIIGNKLGCKPSLADADLWYKPMITSEGID